MRKDRTTANLTESEIERNKQISKKRYIRFQPVRLPGRRVEQYLRCTYLNDSPYRARFTSIIKNIWNARYEQMAFSLFRGSKFLPAA